jgi:pimeloyl-ACP methyl ester carboxylesterase
MAIDALEAIQIGDTTQWIRVRGADDSNPVLLLIQQGPGLPMMNEADRFQRLLGLEGEFTVVYWDQRGCGRSRRGQDRPTDVTLGRLVVDTVELLELLHERFGPPIYVAGFSLGATLGAFAAARRPHLVTTLVAVGMDIDGKAAAISAYDFALRTARDRGNRRALRQLEAIGRPPHLEVKQFATVVRWNSNFGGAVTNETYGSMFRALVASLLRSPDYSPADVVRTFRGITPSRRALLPELAAIDLVRTLPRLDVPVVMAQGRKDRVAPGEAAERYASMLDAPSMHFEWFDDSAHAPHFEEPDQFRRLLLRVKGTARAQPVAAAGFEERDNRNAS